MDILRSYKMILKRRQSLESEESQPLESSHSSSTISFGTFQNQCMFHDTDTTDCELDNSAKPATTLNQIQTSRKILLRRPFSYPSSDIYIPRDNVYEKYNYLTKSSGILNDNSNLGEKEFADKVRSQLVDYDNILEAYRQHKHYENKVLQSLKKMGLEVRVVNRLTYNDECVKWADIVIPTGGDGTFLLAASRIRDNVTPIMGFNSDPNRSEGHLCLPKHFSYEVDEAIQRLRSNEFEWYLRSRIRATVVGNVGEFTPHDLHKIPDKPQEVRPTLLREKGRILPYLALNEVFIGESISAKVSHLDIWLNDDPSHTSVKCSGLCVCTGTGSTSWYSSINRISVQTVGELLRLLDMNPTEDKNSLATILSDLYNKNLVFDPTQKTMCYTIRDLICAGVWPQPKGIKPRGFSAKIKVQSKCYDASLVIDGDSFKVLVDIRRKTGTYKDPKLPGHYLRNMEHDYGFLPIGDGVGIREIRINSRQYGTRLWVPPYWRWPGICLYTAQTILRISDSQGNCGDVPELCKILLGRWAEILAKIFSLIVLIGANIVYWILMSNFLYNSVDFIYGYIIAPDEIDNKTVLCPKEEFNRTGTTSLSAMIRPSNFYDVWNMYNTVPVFLAALMFPFLNFKSPTFFTKFNSLGAVSVCYMIAFVIVKACGWGIQEVNWLDEVHVKPTFQALSGMLALSYFIHNIIVSVMRSNRQQQHNVRDLSIAYCLVLFTYVFVGVLFYVSFPLDKSCIEDNFLNNFPKHDPLTIVARLLLLFQLFTVFPLMCFMLRMDIFTNFKILFNTKKNSEFSYVKVIILNLSVVTVCILFACFLPKIGTLIRYTGALSGMVYIFALPSLLKIAHLHSEKNLTPFICILHVIVVLLGILNFCLQFFITDS
ncbi:ATP-NAD kinase N-terminal domain [Popillia japonica]|uniref:NAD(+) kinase n=1 Tax=Popillia japonica TaxID=7064 RepID=A0AAW1MXB8_POPJA